MKENVTQKWKKHWNKFIAASRNTIYEWQQQTRINQASICAFINFRWKQTQGRQNSNRAAHTYDEKRKTETEKERKG